ncbi:hypothetical protein RAA17_12775 [Komagataeibacter rhaeticus]|nr:hypothetical protein [Komagataeibacter rhaeticus]
MLTLLIIILLIFAIGSGATDSAPAGMADHAARVSTGWACCLSC